MNNLSRICDHVKDRDSSDATYCGQAISLQQIALFRDSFAAVKPFSETTASLFYARLFELGPEVRPLFPHSISAQGAKLMAAQALVVDILDRLDSIRPEIIALAQRHISYGATDAHYAAEGDALTWALGQGLGDNFLIDVREAWLTVYGGIADTMIAASRGGDHRDNAGAIISWDWPSPTGSGLPQSLTPVGR